MDSAMFTINAVPDISVSEQKRYHGRDATVFPAILLVEGVLQGVLAKGPELALASEFGRFPDSWNGRPVVLNHPKDGNGLYVSASASPEIMEKNAVGYLFNTRVNNKKLHSELWIMHDRVNALSSDVLDRLKNGDITEVSVGIFGVMEESQGIYEGQQYQYVWRNVAPDHLAVLDAGTNGACSAKDGCGVPRVHTKPSCDCGGKTTEEVKTMSDTTEKTTDTTETQTTEVATAPVVTVNVQAQEKSTAQTETPKEPVVETPDKVLTMEEFIATAPEDMRIVLNESLALRDASRKDLVASLIANERCKFTEQQLTAKSTDELNMLAELASAGETKTEPKTDPEPKTDYSVQGGTPQQQQKSNGIPAPINVFEIKRPGEQKVANA